MRVLTLFTLLGTAAISAAQCRQVQQYVPHAYAQNYNQTYYNQYEVIKPVAIATFIVPNSFYQVAPELADARIKQQIADDAADRAIQRLMLSLQQQQQQQGNANPPPVGIAPRAEHPSSLATKAAAVVKAECVNCHRGPGSKDGGKLDLRNPETLSAAQWNHMVVRCTLPLGEEGHMPQDKKMAEQSYDDIAHHAYEFGKRGLPSIPKAVADPKPPMVPAPMNKAKEKSDDDGALSLLDPESQLDKKKKKPKPRPKPIG